MAKSWFDGQPSLKKGEMFTFSGRNLVEADPQCSHRLVYDDEGWIYCDKCKGTAGRLPRSAWEG